MSINWQPDVNPPPRLLVLPAAAASLDEAHAAIEQWEYYSGKTLDPSQRLAVEIMMAQDAAGKWAASTTGREMPRQNGKGDEVEVVELWGLVQRAEAILHTVHDAVLLATQTQQRMLSVLEGHADLRRLIKRTWRGTGQQMIEMRNGGAIWYRTRTGSGGRGVDDIDRLVVDEAQHADAEQMASVTPTLLANADPQLNATGTAAIEHKSDWWWTFRERAFSDDPGAFAYLGHTAEHVELVDGEIVQHPVDASDRSLWPGANPAVVSGRGGGMAFLEEQFQRLGADKFAREHLGVFDPPTKKGAAARLVPADDWAQCCHPEAERGEHVAYAVAVGQDGAGASIAASDGTVVRVLAWDKGSRWLVARLAEILAARPGEVWLDPKSPTGALLPDLTDAGIEWRTVSGTEMAQACGGFLTAVTDGHTLSHGGQATLDIAVANCTRKNYGGAWVWDPRKATVDVSPLDAVTIARWAALQVPEAVAADFFTL